MRAQQAAPFPYVGGKARVAATIWRRFGRLDRYIEPFCGSAAVVLSEPADPQRLEIIGDANGFICNAWRAIQADPDAVARHAEWPSIHADLLARHRWLVQWGRSGALARLAADPDWYDARAAGWWIWGVSNWITTSDFCVAAFTGAVTDGPDVPDCIPHVPPEPRGRGVTSSKVGDGLGVRDGIPHIPDWPTGQGVQAAKFGSGPTVADKRPRIQPDNRGAAGVQAMRRGDVPDFRVIPHKPGGRGVTASKVGDGPGDSRRPPPPEWERGKRWRRWMRALAVRLSRVTILARSWESCVQSRSVLGIVAPRLTTGVYCDPPYRHVRRRANLYAADSETVAEDVWKWALEHGENPRLRIAVSMMEGDFRIPKGWTTHRWRSTAVGKGRRSEIIVFSPHCVDGAPSLFGA